VFETGKYKMESIAGTAVGEVNLYLCCRQGIFWPRGRRPTLRSGSDSYEPRILDFAIGNSAPPEDAGPFPPPLASVRYMAVTDGELVPVVRCACVSKLFVLQPPQYRHLTDKRPYQGRFSDASRGRRGPG
jgi:hypothetical protein